MGKRQPQEILGPLRHPNFASTSRTSPGGRAARRTRYPHRPRGQGGPWAWGAPAPPRGAPPGGGRQITMAPKKQNVKKQTISKIESKSTKCKAPCFISEQKFLPQGDLILRGGFIFGEKIKKKSHPKLRVQKFPLGHFIVALIALYR